MLPNAAALPWWNGAEPSDADVGCVHRPLQRSTIYQKENDASLQSAEWHHVLYFGSSRSENRFAEQLLCEL